MRFRTEFISTPSPLPVDPEVSALLLGSCFSDNIGDRMRQCRWDARVNPCGVLYNPFSIARVIRLALGDADMARSVQSSLTADRGIWNSWLCDSGAASDSAETTAAKVTAGIGSLSSSLAEAGVLIVTFGTAWIYELADNPGYVVANCHKRPASMFTRRRLSVEEVVDIWSKLLDRLTILYPHLRIIFTVSPVRHLKDGFKGNARSKAILLLACERLCSGFPFAEYFPAYEIVTDDLRDYRFYADDLVHPSAEAVEYVWEKFLDRFVSPGSRRVLEEGESITKALGHRPLIDGCMAAADMQEHHRMKTEERLGAFREKHPGML